VGAERQGEDVTKRQVQEVYRRFLRGKSVEELARLYHVTVEQIEQALREGKA